MMPRTLYPETERSPRRKANSRASTSFGASAMAPRQMALSSMSKRALAEARSSVEAGSWSMVAARSWSVWQVWRWSSQRSWSCGSNTRMVSMFCGGFWMIEGFVEMSSVGTSSRAAMAQAR